MKLVLVWVKKNCQGAKSILSSLVSSAGSIFCFLEDDTIG